MDRTLFFYSLTIPAEVPSMSASAVLSPWVIYFSTEKKLEIWRRRHPNELAGAQFGMHEVSLKCVKELLKFSKKKVKVVCDECGR